jgi:hypothetical protein
MSAAAKNQRRRRSVFTNCGKRRQSIVVTLRPAIFDRQVLAFDIAFQALSKCSRGVCPVGGGAGVQKPNHGHARLLRVRYNRPRRHRTAKQRDELAAS